MRDTTRTRAHSAMVRTLSQNAFLSGLDEEILQRIAEQAQVRTFGAGQVIVWMDRPTRAVYLVVQGETRAYRMSLEGRKYVLDYFGPGQFFNLAAALNGGTNKASVEAVRDTTTLVLPCDQLYEIVRAEPGVALAALKYLASAVSQLSDAAADLALHTVRTRLARFLLSQSCNHGRLARSWTQEDIAAHIGSVRDVVGRMLRSFLSEGLIRWERNRLAVADLDGLMREAGAIESCLSVGYS